MKYFISLLLFYGSITWGYKVPELAGPVMDQAGILNVQEVAELSQKIRSIHDQGIAQIQVLIIPSLDNDEIESVSIQITDKWKLGDAKKDNGILFLIAIKEKKMRLEIGQGLEGDIPDLASQRILVSKVQPYFKQGQFALGISSGIDSIVQRILGQATADSNPENIENDTQKGKGQKWLFLIYIIVFIIIAMMRRPPGGRGFGGRRGVWMGGGGFGGGWGSGGGGGWSGGGGGFSGGGSSSGW